MKSAVSQELPQTISAPPSDPPGANDHVPHSTAADFWLNVLFRNAGKRQWIVSALRPVARMLALRCSKKLRNATLANARHILGPDSTPQQRTALANRVILNFVDFVSDVARCTDLSPQQMRDRIDEIVGHNKFLAARSHKRGAIIVTAHMGSFEIGTAGLIQYEANPIHVVFRRDAYDRFDETRSEMRRKLGVIESPVEQGWTMWLKLRDALMKDEVVMIQGDRVTPGQKGQTVKFFDGHTLLPTGPVKLALASGAPILPVFNVRGAGGRVKLFIEDPIFVTSPDEVDAAMNKLAGVIERYVRQYPDQWLTIHPAWCEDQP